VKSNNHGEIHSFGSFNKNSLSYYSELVQKNDNFTPFKLRDFCHQQIVTFESITEFDNQLTTLYILGNFILFNDFLTSLDPKNPPLVLNNLINGAFLTSQEFKTKFAFQNQKKKQNIFFN